MSNTKYNFTLKASRVQIDPAQSYGYWERADGSEGGGLWFNGKELVDFDGAFELPAVVKDQIVTLGFTVGEEF